MIQNMVRHAMIWSGVVWYTVWCGSLRYDTVSCGMVYCVVWYTVWYGILCGVV